MITAIVDSRDSLVKLKTPASSTQREELLRRAAQAMVTARLYETRITSLYRAGKIVGGVYTGKGQEAFSAALGVCLHPGDVFAPLIRDAAGRIAFGEPLEDAFRTYLGSASGPMRGRDGNVHRGRPLEGYPAMISHLGTSLSVVNGMLLARRMQGKQGSIGAATAGDGATSTGAFHEGLNQAAVMKLPLIVAVANNAYAYSTPNSSQFACEDLLSRAEGYGIGAHRVARGNHLGECLSAFQAAADAVRAGKGPQLVVGSLLRLSGHGEHDDASYVDERLRQSNLGQDCLDIAREELIHEGIFNADSWAQLEVNAALAIQQVQSQVSREAAPDPYTEDWSSYAAPHAVS